MASKHHAHGYTHGYTPPERRSFKTLGSTPWDACSSPLLGTRSRRKARFGGPFAFPACDSLIIRVASRGGRSARAVRARRAAEGATARNRSGQRPPCDHTLERSAASGDAWPAPKGQDLRRHPPRAALVQTLRRKDRAGRAGLSSSASCEPASAHAPASAWAGIDIHPLRHLPESLAMTQRPRLRCAISSTTTPSSNATSAPTTPRSRTCCGTSAMIRSRR
jgi:hypothetical protein